MTEYQYNVEIHLAGAGSGKIEGETMMSFGSVKGKASQTLTLHFVSREDILEMMVDNKPYIRFTVYGYDEREYFFYKANILYVSQWREERL